MPGAARSVVLRSLTGALLLSSTLLGRQSAAQQVSVASARITSTVRSWTGADSGKVLLSVEIADLPGAVRSARSRDKIKVADEDGRIYTPVGVGFRSLDHRSSLVPEYLQTASARRMRPQYMFLVPPGNMRFVLHVTSQQPVEFTASVAAGAFRQ